MSIYDGDLINNTRVNNSFSESHYINGSIKRRIEMVEKAIIEVEDSIKTIQKKLNSLNQDVLENIIPKIIYLGEDVFNYSISSELSNKTSFVIYIKKMFIVGWRVELKYFKDRDRLTLSEREAKSIINASSRVDIKKLDFKSLIRLKSELEKLDNMFFNVPRESNTMNPLLSGDTDEIIDVIGNMLETGGTNDLNNSQFLFDLKNSNT